MNFLLAFFAGAYVDLLIGKALHREWGYVAFLGGMAMLMALSYAFRVRESS